MSEDEFHESRDELRTIRSAWKELHQFVKSAVDADTLNQPSALISFMLSRVRQLPGLSDADFAIFHTDKFNYLQVNPTSIRQALRDLVFIVGGEEFPNSLGLIGIPSTQGSSLFLNCLVAHEMGEYVFAEKSLRNRLQPEVETALHVVCGSAYQAREKTEKSFFIDTILKWSKELFCDFFAVHLIGLSYTLAYIELFDLVNLLDRDGAIKSSSPQPPIHFYSAHPSHPFRVKHQTDLLKRLDWWPYVSGIDSRYVRVMEALGGLDDASFIDANDTANKALVESFLKVLPEVAAELGKIVGSLDTGVHEFSELRKDILSYLQEGIVPSTLMIENPGGAVVKARPSGMALLNSFSCFYLENVEPLMARAGQESGPAERRVYWIRKLESWISKALEDSNLLGES